MRIYWPSFCTFLRFFVITDSSLFSTIQVPLVAQWETVASSIIQRYVSSIYDVYLICNSPSVSDEFLKTVPVPRSLSQPGHLHDNSFLFLFATDESLVLSVLHKASNFPRSKYIIFVECGECSTIAWTLEQCWTQKLLNIIVISISNETIPIYTYFPFREGECFDSSPVLIDHYTDSFSLDVELFPTRKVWNLRNCKLTVSSFATYPAVYFDSSRRIKGLYSSVFYALAQFMNFSYDFIHIDGKDWYGSVSGEKKTGIRGDVYAKRAHLGFQMMQPIDAQLLDYDSLPMTGCITWCLPSSFKQKSVWSLVVGEFTPCVWLMLFLSAAGIVLTDLVARRLDRRSSPDVQDMMYMQVWASLLQIGGMPPRTSQSLRILWISWLLISVVISTLYLGSLKSLRTAPYVEYSVKSLDDLAQAGYPAWYPKGLANLVDDVSETNRAVARLKSNSRVYPNEMTGAVIAMLAYKNLTVLVVDKICELVGEMYTGKVDLYPVPNACMRTTTWHLFVMEKNSIFTDRVNTFVNRLTQAGIVQRSLKGNFTSSRSAEIKRRPIDFGTIFPILLLLGLGFSASLLFFAIEFRDYRVN